MMSTSSFTNFGIFVAICGVATTAHAISQVVATVKQISSITSEASNTSVDPSIQARPKLVVISGCDRGFGYLLVERLLQKTDYLVLALALTDKGVHALKALDDDDKEDAASQLFALRCNVTSDNDVQQVGQAVQDILQERNAVLYSIVNNAGIASAGDFVFFSNLDKYQQVMDVNFFGHLRLTQTLLPAMLETSSSLQMYPRIINMSSVCGVAVSPSNSTYNASKFALEAWSDALRMELEPFHIKVVKIRPGQTNTQIQKDWAITYNENFAKAPPRIQELYGGQAFLDKVNEFMKGMGDGNASPPEIVVDTLVNTLTMKHSRLKAAYFVGNDAQTLWRAFRVLPTPVSDFIKGYLRFKYPITAEEVGASDNKPQ